MFQNAGESIKSLSKCHWYGIFQLGTSHLNNVCKLRSFLSESLDQCCKVFHQFKMGIIQTNVNGCRIRVIGRLRTIDVIVGRAVLVLSACVSHQFQCNHFIGIHVGSGSGPSLNHIYRELVMMFSFQYFFTSLQYGIRLFLSQ